MLQQQIEDSNPHPIEVLESKPLNITFEDRDPVIKEEYLYLSSQNISKNSLGTDLSSVNECPRKFQEVEEESEESMFIKTIFRRKCSYAQTRKMG